MATVLGPLTDCAPPKGNTMNKTFDRDADIFDVLEFCADADVGAAIANFGSFAAAAAAIRQEGGWVSWDGSSAEELCGDGRILIRIP